MKIVTIILQSLLGLAFAFFGSNAIFHFLPGEPPPGPGADFAKLLTVSHYFLFIGATQLVGGLLLLSNRFAPLGLTLLGPVIVNILLFHALLLHAGWQPAVIVALLWFFLFFRYRANFSGLFAAPRV